MTEDQTHAENVNPSTGEIEVRRPPTTNAWLERLQPNPTTDGWIPAMPSIIRAAEYVYQTPFVPPGLRTPGGTVGAIMYGREIGLPPMTAVQSIHEIKGNVGMKAETMRAMILAAGHEFRVIESTAQRCRIRARRKSDAGNEDAWQVVEYTYAEAVLAGDDRNKEGKQQGTNYQRRPVDMLVARCTTRAARLIFPDVIRGLGGVEELDDLAREELRDREGNPFHGDEPRTTGVVRQQPGAESPAPEAPRRRATPADARRRKPAEPKTEAVTPKPEPAKPEQKPDAEPVDAEFVEVPDAPDAEPVTAPPADETKPEPSPPAEGDGPDRPAGPGIAAAQRATMMGHFSRFGLGEDREERLAVLSTIVGRTVESANDLTRAEASRAIDFLGKTRDRDRLYATMDSAASAPEPEAEA